MAEEVLQHNRGSDVVVVFGALSSLSEALPQYEYKFIFDSNLLSPHSTLVHYQAIFPVSGDLRNSAGRINLSLRLLRPII